MILSIHMLCLVRRFRVSLPPELAAEHQVLFPPPKRLKGSIALLAYDTWKRRLGICTGICTFAWMIQ